MYSLLLATLKGRSLSLASLALNSVERSDNDR